MTQSSSRKRFKQFGRSVTRVVAGYARDFGKTIVEQAQDLSARFDAYEFRMRDIVPVSKYVLGLGTMTAIGGAVAAPRVTVAPVKQTDVPSLAVDDAIAKRHAAKMQMAETISAFHYGIGLTTDQLTPLSDALVEAENTDAIQDAVLETQGEFPDDAERVTRMFQEHPNVHAHVFADVWQQQQEAIAPIASQHLKFLPILGIGVEVRETDWPRIRPIHPRTRKRNVPHNGIDLVLKSKRATLGAQVYTPFAVGVVTKIENRRGKLNHVVIEAEDGTTATYMHIKPLASLRVGQKLDVTDNPKGEIPVGTIAGRDRWSTGAHVHVEFHNKYGRNITQQMYQKTQQGEIGQAFTETRTGRAMHPDLLGFMRANPDADACGWENFKAEKHTAFEKGDLGKKEFEQQQITFDAVDESLMQSGLGSADSIEVHAYGNLRADGNVLDSLLVQSAAEIMALQAEADEEAYRRQLEENPPQEVVFKNNLDESTSLQSSAQFSTGKEIKLDYVPDEVESDIPNLLDVNREIIQKQEADRMLAVILQAKKNGVFATAKTEPKTKEQLRADALNFARLTPQ